MVLIQCKVMKLLWSNCANSIYFSRNNIVTLWFTRHERPAAWPGAGWLITISLAWCFRRSLLRRLSLYTKSQTNTTDVWIVWPICILLDWYVCRIDVLHQRGVFGLHAINDENTYTIYIIKFPLQLPIQNATN